VVRQPLSPTFPSRFQHASACHSIPGNQVVVGYFEGHPDVPLRTISPVTTLLERICMPINAGPGSIISFGFMKGILCRSSFDKDAQNALTI
jgi:hypothetical protein